MAILSITLNPQATMAKARDLLATPSHEDLLNQLAMPEETLEFQSALALYDLCARKFPNCLTLMLLKIYQSSSNETTRFQSINLLSSTLVLLRNRKTHLSLVALIDIKPLLISCLKMKMQETHIKILRKIVSFVAYNAVSLDDGGWDELSDCILIFVDTEPLKAFHLFIELPRVYKSFIDRFMHRILQEGEKVLLLSHDVEEWSLGVQILDSVSGLVNMLVSVLAKSVKEFVNKGMVEFVVKGLENLERFLLRDRDLYSMKIHRFVVPEPRREMVTSEPILIHKCKQNIILVYLWSTIPLGRSHPNGLKMVLQTASGNDIFSFSASWIVVLVVVVFLCGCAVGKFLLHRRVNEVQISGDANVLCASVGGDGGEMDVDAKVEHDEAVDHEDDEVVDDEDDDHDEAVDHEDHDEAVDHEDDIASEEHRRRHRKIPGSEMWTLLDGITTGFLYVDSFSFDGKEIDKLFTEKKKSVVGCEYLVIEGYNSPRDYPVAIKRIPRSICEEYMIKKEFNHQRRCCGESKQIMEAFAYKLNSEFCYMIVEQGVCHLNDLVKFSMTKKWERMQPTEDIAAIAKVIDEEWKKGESSKDKFRLSTLKLKLIRDIVEGVYDMHNKKIVHRKLEPSSVQIVLSGTQKLGAKISEFSASKLLAENELRFRYFVTHQTGDTHWRAPEQLVRQDETSAVDLFSLGCIIFFIITGGKHPFGRGDRRTFNITSNKFDITEVRDKPECFHLIDNLLNHIPCRRFTASEVIKHPLFWNPEKRLSFLRAVSERIDMDSDSKNILTYLEKRGRMVMGGYSWDLSLSAEFLAYVKKQKEDKKLNVSYEGKKASHLLRLVRNTVSHYSQLPQDIKQHLGTYPDGFNEYITRKFPHMLIEVYLAVLKYYNKDETVFQKFF